VLQGWKLEAATKFAALFIFPSMFPQVQSDYLPNPIESPYILAAFRRVSTPRFHTKGK